VFRSRNILGGKKVIGDVAEPAVPGRFAFVFLVLKIHARVAHELLKMGCGDGAAATQSLPEVKHQAVLNIVEGDRPLDDLLSSRG
jgi:hypothetical protein